MSDYGKIQPDGLPAGAPRPSTTEIKPKMVDGLARCSNDCPKRHQGRCYPFVLTTAYEVETGAICGPHYLARVAELEERNVELCRRNGILATDRDRLAEMERIASESFADEHTRARRLEEMLRWCVEGHEGSVRGFWDSPLGKRLKSAGFDEALAATPATDKCDNSGALLIKIHPPEGYENTHPEIVFDDLQIDPAWGAELVGGQSAPAKCETTATDGGDDE